MENVLKTHCNGCNRETNHSILFHKEIEDGDEETYITYESYQVVECMGCESVSFLRSVSIPDDPDEIIWYNYPETKYDGFYNFLNYEVQDSLPRMINDLYEEIMNTFKTESAILAGVGLRMLVEAVCLDQKINGKNLQEKIRKLSEQGLISESEVPILDKLRLIGNFSAHQIKSISLDKLHYSLDIINHILQSIYFLPKINKKIKI